MDRCRTLSAVALTLALGSSLFLSGCSPARERAGVQSAPLSVAPKPESPQFRERAASAPAEPMPGGPVSQARYDPGWTRKIVYTAEVTLQVKDLAKLERDLRGLVRRCAGYVSDAEVGGEPGVPKSGTWTVRIPVARFDEFTVAAKSLGALENYRVTSEDVSAEFYDVSARLRSKRVEEQRLLQHLLRTTAKLQDILAVERELSRVHSEIEQMQGRLNQIENLASLTTVTVSASETKQFSAQAPLTFGGQIAQTFRQSIATMVDVGKGLVIAAVAFVPWVVLCALIALVAWGIIRRYKPRVFDARQDQPVGK